MYPTCLSSPLPSLYLENEYTLVGPLYKCPQFPPSVAKKRYDGYEADNEKKGTKRKDVRNCRGRKLRKRTSTMGTCREYTDENDEENDQMDSSITSTAPPTWTKVIGNTSEFSEPL